jgi:hypothetical protein
VNLGTQDKKKVGILGGLVVLIVGLLYYNSSSSDSPTTTVTTTRRAVPASTDEIIEPTTATRTNNTPARTSRTSITEFRPRVMGNRAGDKIDPTAIDPKLRLDLLAKVQAVEPIEAGRNLFQFGQAPAPDKPLPAMPTTVPKINVSSTERTPPPAPPVPTGPPPPPPAPPINLKYYGYSVAKADGHKEAFLMDGEDVLLAAENQTLKQRYRIVRIALGSIDIEDLQYKNTQTLKIQDLPPG